MPDSESNRETRQLGLGLEDTRPDPTHVDAAEIRAELHGLLATARAARDAAPWDQRTHRYHAVVFQQMANWLPADEADSLRRDFAIELERIGSMLGSP